MCGLIAGTGHIEPRRLVALGCLSESRGHDSAGVGWQAGDRLRTVKYAQNPLVAFPVGLSPAIRHAARYGAPIIGHTRQATQGAVTARNAHPFLDTESRIAWAHNGVILNDKHFGKFEVDSESLIFGIKKKDFSEFEGMFALVWIEDGKLHALRHRNPLYRGLKKGGVYLASESDFLKEIGCHKIKELSPRFEYVWENDRLISTKAIKCKEAPAYERSAIFADEEWPNYTFPKGHNYWYGGYWHSHTRDIAWEGNCQGCKELFAEEDKKTRPYIGVPKSTTKCLGCQMYKVDADTPGAWCVDCLEESGKMGA